MLRSRTFTQKQVPEKLCKKHQNSALCPPFDFQKMISLWCRKIARLRRFSTPHSPLQKQSPIITVSPGRQFLAAISCLNFLIATCRKTGTVRVFSLKLCFFEKKLAKDITDAIFTMMICDSGDNRKCPRLKILLKN